MRKTILLTITLLLLSAGSAFAGELPALQKEAIFTIDSTTVAVDGVKYKIDAAPFIERNRTFMPFRYLGEVLGAEVEWDASNREAKLNLKNGKIIILKEKEVFINDNGKYKLMDVVPTIVPPGRICLPARYVVESAGYTVEWDADTRQMLVKRQG